MDNVNVDSTLRLEGVLFDVFKQALLGYCQNGESPDSATEKAFNVVRTFAQKTFNEKNNTHSIGLFNGLEKIEHLSGKKIPDSKRYDVGIALEKGMSPNDIISNNPDLFDKA